jgi:hypothetical protein
MSHTSFGLYLMDFAFFYRYARSQPGFYGRLFLTTRPIEYRRLIDPQFTN